MKLNRKWLMIIALVMSLTMATAGTLAFLTDRDSEANVFTMGNVEIDLNEKFNPEDATLIPGVDIEKMPTITNTGNTDAWVWMIWSIPAALDSDEALGTNNYVHYNYYGGTAKDFYAQEKYYNSLKTALTEKGIEVPSHQELKDKKMYWTIDQKIGEKTENGIKYNCYAYKYNKALTPGETTLPSIHTVYLDDHIDINTDGQLYYVDKGVATKIDWNIKTQGNPVIYVNAYAMQKNEFADVEAAFTAYANQWTSTGDSIDGIEFAKADNEIDSEVDVVLPTDKWIDFADTSWYGEGTATIYEIDTAEELAGLAKIVNEYTRGVYNKGNWRYPGNDNPFNGQTIKLTADIDLDGKLWTPIGIPNQTLNAFWGTFDGNGHTITNLTAKGGSGVGLFGAIFYSGDWGIGMATVKNVTVDNAIVIGDEYVGVIVGHSYGHVTDCTVKNATITAKEEAGAIVGSTPSDAAPIDVTGNKATNVTITADEHVGAILGRAWSAVCTYTGNTCETVTVNGANSTEVVGSLNK